MANALYARSPGAHRRSIKGYLQVLKIVIYAVATILVIAALIDRSPLLLLSGLGALAAVLMLVFKDTILSLVASVQLNSNDMLRVGDWIEMPQVNADGDVIDIALHTVKVQNWDKTITTALIAPMSMLSVIGPAPSVARLRPKSINSCRSRWAVFFPPRRVFSILSVAAFDRLGAFPTDFMSSMCRSISSPNVRSRADRDGVGTSPRSIRPSASVAHRRASSRLMKVSLI